MMKCWSFNPEERPTFRYCLDVLDDILSHTDDVALQGTFISKLRFLSSTASKKKVILLNNITTEATILSVCLSSESPKHSLESTPLQNLHQT